MLKISVIVPVYNMEQYIEKCLKSIINQTYKNIELIIINDGSTDNSEEIIIKYKNKFPNIIRPYKQENKGLAAARNFGIKKAKGEYICFLDSDDYIDVNLFSKLEKYMNEKIELIKYKLIKTNENYEEIKRVGGPVFDKLKGEEAFNLLCLQDELYEPSCLYLYKQSLLLKNKFKFQEGLYHEDFGLTALIIIKAKSVASIKNYGYYYVQTSNSIMRTTDYNIILKRAKDLLIHYDNMINSISKYKICEKTKHTIKTYFINSILLVVKDLNENDQKRYTEEIKKRKLIKELK